MRRPSRGQHPHGAAPIDPTLDKQAEAGDGGEHQREICDLGEDARPEPGELLIDQRRQHPVAARDTEQGRGAEIADIGDEGEGGAGNQRRPGHRQDDVAQDAPRISARRLCRLEELARQGTQPGAQAGP